MTFHKKMFWGEEAKKRRFELTWKLKAGKFPAECYLIFPADASSPNLLELVSGEELYSPLYRPKKNVVVGLAANRQEAFETVRQMFDAVYLQTKDTKIKEYFQK